jgi:hypothetical protein
MSPVGSYHQVIDGIIAASGMSDKMLHMHVGMALYLGAQVAFRTRRGSIDALLVVVIAEVANEIMDRLFFGSWRWSDTLGDIGATLFWPAACVAVSRYRRRRWARAERRRQWTLDLGGQSSLRAAR